MNDVFFKNREEAGQRLAEKLFKYKDENPVVLALPRGGVVLGGIIAEKLKCSLDLLITRKIGHPMSPEYAIGAITVSGEAIFNEEEVRLVNKDWLEKEKRAQIKEAKRRQDIYLKNRKAADLKGKTVIIVDDGIATGLTMLAGIKEVKAKKPAKIVVAVPVSPPDTYEKIAGEADDFAAISIPDYFLGAIGTYYGDFPQVTDDEVIKILQNI
jgi:predicted phosphoribosyltransferase